MSPSVPGSSAPSGQATGARPLQGITVVDLTVNIAGPSASLILADLGARVIKVEPPGGDVSRSWHPQADGVATVFAAFNRSKESVVIDAKTERGRGLLHRMVADADVFVESMRPGKADALGLGWEQLSEINPRLIYCSINAFGSVGPMAGVAGFDAIIQAYSGLMDLTGYPDAEPARVGGAVIDVGTGMWAALGVVTAVLQRHGDGCGRYVPVTMLGTAVSYLMHHLTTAKLTGVDPERLGTAQHNFAPYQGVRALDRMVMVGINTDVMFARAMAALGHPGLAADPRFATNGGRLRNRGELVEEIEKVTSLLLSDDVVDRLTSANVPVSVVRPVGALACDPQMDELGLWGSTPEGVQLPRTPLASATAQTGSIPAAGADTLRVLRELGVEQELLSTLLDLGVIAEAVPPKQKELT
ncbi:MAG: L-carnitine dehydratase/bile acid-inducible protein F [uncultured Arthrobacter sp.]|uniref:L-carnitine dehydratase/bile acid-inducible protein F n=1 Tax=uncultured Arthrobacter sp. TaxID=114050 RepID=A0A6J4IZI4_9MICC|nr:CoA transferase [uncultured Arthrobacter sp.]CAA9263675.1 MAG: L-carnitine dehydratase/bile acid-inducible protein F [uncultured Arthrobacter sp.]